MIDDDTLLRMAKAKAKWDRLRDKAPELLAMLRELEWSWQFWPGHGMDEQTGLCPVCEVAKPMHDPHCRLRLLLDEVGE